LSTSVDPDTASVDAAVPTSSTASPAQFRTTLSATATWTTPLLAPNPRTPENVAFASAHDANTEADTSTVVTLPAFCATTSRHSVAAPITVTRWIDARAAPPVVVRTSNAGFRLPLRPESISEL
jgi:hypothetical protein